MWKTAFKKFEVRWSVQADHVTSHFLMAVFHTFYLVHFLILCPTYTNTQKQNEENTLLENVYTLCAQFQLNRERSVEKFLIKR